MDGVKITVINLDCARDRLEAIAGRLGLCQVDWERFSAISISKDSVLIHPQYRPDECLRYYGVHLTAGELGCFLSHLEVLRAFLASSDELLLVLEDDVVICPAVVEKVGRVVDFLLGSRNLRWSVVNLSEVYPKRRRLLGSLMGGIQIFRAYYFPMLASALLWNKHGVKRFLDFVRVRGIFMPIDQQLRFFLAEAGDGLSLGAPIVPLTAVSSTIGYRVSANSRLSKFARKSHNYFYSFWNQMFRN